MILMAYPGYNRADFFIHIHT